MKNLMQKMYSLYLLEVYTDIEKVEKITNTKENLIHLLQSAVGSGSYELYKKYSAGIHNLPPINIRDFLEFKKQRKPIDIK